MGKVVHMRTPAKRAASRREWSLALGLGLALGIGYAAWPEPAGVPESSPAFEGAPPPTPDPWAESRRSRAILEAQEAAPPNALEAPPRPVAGGTVRYASLRVIDGDTFDYGGARIRIADIDAPEMAARCAHEARLAAAAAGRLNELLAAGPFELRRIDRERDRYGRKLRVVTRGGQSIGDRLVAEGLARPWRGRREPWC